MRSIERRFHNIQNKHPHWSSYICFVEAVIDQQFSDKTIAAWFNRLVEKSDYSKGDKKAMLRYLSILSNGHDEGAN